MQETTDEFLNYLRMLGGGLRTLKDLTGNRPSNTKNSNKVNYNINSPKLNSPKLKRKERHIIAKMKKWQKKHTEDFFKDTQFIWTGSHSDLCFFYAAEKMPYSIIDELDKEHPITAKNAKAAMEKAVNDGYLIHQTDGYILSSEGWKHISTESFMQSARQNLKNAKISKKDVPVVKKTNQMFMFDGTEGDMRVFDTVKEFNLDDVCAELISKGHSNLSDKVFVNFMEWTKKGYVNEINGICSRTLEGIKFMDSDEFKKAFRKNADEKGSGSYETETVVGDAAKKSDMPYTSYYVVFNDEVDVDCSFKDFLSTIEDNSTRTAYKTAFRNAVDEGLYDNFNREDWFFALRDRGNGDVPKVIFGSRTAWQNEGYMTNDGKLTQKGEAFADNNSTVKSSVQPQKTEKAVEKTSEKAADVGEKAKNATEDVAGEAVGASVGTAFHTASMPINVFNNAINTVQDMALSK